MSERLGLGSATGVNFLPQSTEFPPHKLTESLCVNNSFSSLASLAGNDSVAGENKGCWFCENSERKKGCWFCENSEREKGCWFCENSERKKYTGFVRTLREKVVGFYCVVICTILNFVQN